VVPHLRATASFASDIAMSALIERGSILRAAERVAGPIA
jgi:hypothetical protein